MLLLPAKHPLDANLQTIRGRIKFKDSRLGFWFLLNNKSFYLTRPFSSILPGGAGD
jgi:hypothetical protein